MNPKSSGSPFGGQDSWNTEILQSAILELRREFPRLSSAQVAQALIAAATLLKPTDGVVALLQAAREKLKALK